MASVGDRRTRLAAARLYLVADALDDDRLAAALRGGVDVVQLRMKDAGDEAILGAAARIGAACRAAGALFFVNDRPELALAADADGVHVGQDDAGVAAARAVVGDDRLVGVSTHKPSQLADAAHDGADYAGVGPVHATPTKPGRPAVGLEYVAHAAAHAQLAWFAIGGIDPTTVDAVAEAGASRIVVVRAITEAPDAERAARTLRAAITARDGAGLGVA